MVNLDTPHGRLAPLGSAYEIGRAGTRWTARRRDDGTVLTAGSPEDLDAAIIADYTGAACSPWPGRRPRGGLPAAQHRPGRLTPRLASH